jgi:hypothetical protein
VKSRAISPMETRLNDDGYGMYGFTFALLNFITFIFRGSKDQGGECENHPIL